ncbi:hypothetical protein N836_02740 [Leptolyngbya sp. Heron Island J]|uniref:hypothetical protein n=1 Tax=Leptolyngbya sp. Heron Island J TaxID=1385935 RepID=UPI0003B97657|nr:hypothetical protein [Leptolyngbya sp. Heron Island J]ESA37446.1 hypothetical protein N836_02740 [Leptolyngbya sp. Heron Island J]
MSTVKTMINTIGESIQKSTAWVLKAAKRLFSPSDDNYPDTGVQPFEGDIPETDQP